MANTKRYSKRTFRQAIEGSRGIKTAIAKRLGCSRQTVDNYLERWPDMQPLIRDERDSIIDLAESRLMKAVLEDDMRAILFVLETIGKDRGWTKRTELTGANGAAMFEIPPEALALMKAMNLDPSDVQREFLAILQEAANAEADA